MSGDVVHYEHSHFDYDWINDSMYIYPQDRKYKSSLMLDDIILDVDENNKFVGIEILDASRKFNISKYEMREPVELNVNFEVEDGKLTLNLKMTFVKRNHPVAKTVSVTGNNEMNLSPGSTTLALA
ncbi:DUF2283 domain-containing protein [Methanohalophilus sp. WG1-DM]|jgi:uncharacterized protein YuzE|uniref:DUF2283 domain-containing protein n=1 Tax=Methanohalophilus sp. WG1-DM TaxID=2491675 RepID=UPI000FFEC38E|nr:DUF2283 domain-containing protein [Methanohalophilus sp. WG1-DM]RXG35177.1 hypothetical protein CI957_201 [Methanohalophilus sp. WG1-DM]